MNLAERLRDGTRDLHTQAERSGIMRALLRGQLDRASYCAMLRNLHAIYAALEPALDAQATHPLIAPIYDPQLYRCSAIEADLRALSGESWEALPLTQAGREYAEHLQNVAGADPQRLLAQAYVRYLGDLSGGQMLRKIVRESMQLGSDEGTAFYRFESTPARLLAQRFRAGLDAVPVSDQAADRIIAEARWAFSMHVLLFEELAPLSARDR